MRLQMSLDNANVLGRANQREFIPGLAALSNLNSIFGFAGRVRQAACETVVSPAVLWCFGPERVREPVVPIHRPACVVLSAPDMS